MVVECIHIKRKILKLLYHYPQNYLLDFYFFRPVLEGIKEIPGIAFA